MSFYLIYVIFRRAISSSTGQKSLTPPKLSMLFTPLVTDSVVTVVFILIIITHFLLGGIMESFVYWFAIANPSRASLAGFEIPPRGHRMEARLPYPPDL